MQRFVLQITVRLQQECAWAKDLRSKTLKIESSLYDTLTKRYSLDSDSSLDYYSADK